MQSACRKSTGHKSTIAAALSADGKILASTHGDHTVKIINCETGKCEKVLSGHRRTPWVVRFHPLHPEILAGGSLDHEIVTEYKDSQVPIVLEALERMHAHLTAAVVSNDPLFDQRYSWGYRKMELLMRTSEQELQTEALTNRHLCIRGLTPAPGILLLMRGMQLCPHSDIGLSSLSSIA
ncbi:WD40 repeat-containing protein [Artemisia annua]|uniref:WD40 repeat-containing protein n=1 Tax=Artemisia annua TaxID=35608 RepID=A0A2U1M7F2_ARTAN|nr:WD40 repeat-containing protein [Artemisia annua]